MTHGALQPHVDTLNGFALRRGKHWRDDLSICWCNDAYQRYGCTAQEASQLQQLRNHPDYGPGSEFINRFVPGVAR